MSIDRQTIGVVGYGIVGQAVASGFQPDYFISIYDPPKGYTDLDKFVKESDVFFVCVPTPMPNHLGGPPDLKCIEGVVDMLVKKLIHLNKTIVVKSTIPPGTMDRFAIKYPNFKFVFNPEFLTEKNFIQDFASQDRIVLASNVGKTAFDIGTLYRTRFPETPIIYCGFREAEIAKYASNCFLASKVAFFNEISRICRVFDANYENVRDIVVKDSRIGESHTTVPGTDGQYGFGGKCFPKDLNALIYAAKDKGYDAKLLKQIWEDNLTCREDYDWKVFV